MLFLFSSVRAEEALPTLKVVGNQLIIENRPARLHGFNIPSMEWGQGDHLKQSLDTAAAWGANIIRLPLCQDRWFGKTRERQDGGEHYRQTVKNFVEEASAKRIYVILDLHWSDCGDWGKHIGQHKMPDDHSVEFWESVASAFCNHPAVLFGLYNEPHDVSWEVWRNGGRVNETSKHDPTEKMDYHTPGMQKLLDACRAKGARNVVIAGGLDWAYDLRGLVKGFALSDTNGNGVVYDAHLYPIKQWFTHGDTKSQDWDRIVLATQEKYPVLIGEFGDGKDDYAQKVLDFANQHHLPWTAWCMHPGAKPCLIKDWEYTPTGYGEVVKAELKKINIER